MRQPEKKAKILDGLLYLAQLCFGNNGQLEGYAKKPPTLSINRTETDPHIGGEASHFEHTQKLGNMLQFDDGIFRVAPREIMSSQTG